MAPPRRKIRPAAQKGKKAPPARAKPKDQSSSRSSSYSGSCSRSSDDDDTSSYSGGSDEDDPRDYKRGGYHPVMPYQLYNARYRVLSKLGAGAFSTVWLCTDEKDTDPEGPQLVAMKVCKSKKSVTEQALDEVQLLERLQGSEHVAQMRGHFWHSGPNGRHKCMVFEVMGENLLALVKHFDYNGLPMPMVRKLARHTLLGLEYIHSRGVIHTDVKLENVLLRRHDFEDLISEARNARRAFMEQRSSLESMSKAQKKRAKKKEKKAAQQGQAGAEKKADSDAEDGGAAGAAEADADPADADKAAAEACGRPVPPVRQRERFESMSLDHVFAKLADFGNGCLSNKKVTDDIQTRQYRSPEVIIGAKWNETADVWSAACMFFELLTGDFLFDPRTGDDWSRDEDHLALMIELVGALPPKEWALSGKYSRDFFLNSGKLKHIKSLKFWPLKGVLVEKYSMAEEDAQEVSDFLMPMLQFLPTERQTATEALKHSWVQPVSEADVDQTAKAVKAPSKKAASAEGEAADGADGKKFAPAPRRSEQAESSERRGATDSNEAEVLVEAPQDGAAAVEAPAKAAEAAGAAEAAAPAEGDDDDQADQELDPENEEPNKVSEETGAAKKKKKNKNKGKKG